MKISLPLYVMLPRKTKADKKYILNLNTYRNTHYIVSNQAKILYKEEVLWSVSRISSVESCVRSSNSMITTKVLPHFPNAVKLLFTYYANSKRRIDVANPCSIIDKYATDALVELGVLPDDDVLHVRKVSYEWGGVDKENPRCELEIIDLSI